MDVSEAASREAACIDVCRTIATYQTLNNADRLRKFDPNTFGLIIVDEAHHCAALSYVQSPALPCTCAAYIDSYLRLLHYFNEGVALPAIMSPVMK